MFLPQSQSRGHTTAHPCHPRVGCFWRVLLRPKLTPPLSISSVRRFLSIGRVSCWPALAGYTTCHRLGPAAYRDVILPPSRLPRLSLASASGASGSSSSVTGRSSRRPPHKRSRAPAGCLDSKLLVCPRPVAPNCLSPCPPAVRQWPATAMYRSMVEQVARVLQEAAEVLVLCFVYEDALRQRWMGRPLPPGMGREVQKNPQNELERDGACGVCRGHRYENDGMEIR